MAEPETTPDTLADAPPKGPDGASRSSEKPHPAVPPMPSSHLAELPTATGTASPSSASEMRPRFVTDAGVGPSSGITDAKSEGSDPDTIKDPTERDEASEAPDRSNEPDVATATEPSPPAAPQPAPPRTSVHEKIVRPSSAKVAATGGALGAYEALARSARLPDLVAIAREVVGGAAEARKTEWSFTSHAARLADEAKLSREDAETPFGNALKVLGEGPESTTERALAAALWAHAIAESPRERTEDEDRIAGDVLWLAAHTGFDATPLLDRALGEGAGDLWTAIADRVRRIEKGKGGSLGRAEALTGCAALAASSSPLAKQACTNLASNIDDPILVRLLTPGAGAAASGDVRFEGELLPAPRGPVATTLLALTGLLFAIHGVRLVGRVALAYKRPSEVTFGEAGVRVKTRTEMLGRTLRTTERVILRASLARIEREVRYPRAAFYAGLLALALGSYVGVRSFADGVRAASPSLLLVGLLVIAIGLAADFALGTLLPGSRGRVRVLFVPQKGRSLCVGDVDGKRIDDVLARAQTQR